MAATAPTRSAMPLVVSPFSSIFSAVATCRRWGIRDFQQEALKPTGINIFQGKCRIRAGLEIKQFLLRVELIPPKISSISCCVKSHVMYCGWRLFKIAPTTVRFKLSKGPKRTTKGDVREKKMAIKIKNLPISFTCFLICNLEKIKLTFFVLRCRNALLEVFNVDSVADPNPFDGIQVIPVFCPARIHGHGHFNTSGL